MKSSDLNFTKKSITTNIFFDYTIINKNTNSLYIVILLCKTLFCHLCIFIVIQYMITMTYL